MKKIENLDNSQNNELNDLLMQEDNNHNDFSLDKLYICILVIIIFILTFFLANEEKIKKKINDQIEENFLSNLKRYIKKDAFLEPKVGLCVIGKKENKYAKEYVDHYKSIGFNHIFIYDNNDNDDESFEEVLSEDVSKNFVSIINYRGSKNKYKGRQFEAYIDCYEKNSKNYDWLAFYDFDEFLHLKNNKTIQEFVKEDKFNNCTNIKINWITYSDNDLIYYENKPIEERFKTPLYDCGENIHIKSLVKGHLSKNYWIGMWNPHTGHNNYPCCIPTGEKIDSSTPFNSPPNYEYAYINHHSTKSLEEFIEKTKRGFPDHNVILDEKYWKSRLEYFFAKNKKTKEKLDYIKKTLNIVIN